MCSRMEAHNRRGRHMQEIESLPIGKLMLQWNDFPKTENGEVSSVILNKECKIIITDGGDNGYVPRFITPFLSLNVCIGAHFTVLGAKLDAEYWLKSMAEAYESYFGGKNNDVL